jgi:hypothetical protein
MTDLGPEWIVAEMPPGYHNRLAEIQRLTTDLQDIIRFGGLLSAVGPRLTEVVRDMFVSLKFETEMLPGPAGTGVSVRVEGRGQLLLHMAEDGQVIQKKSPEIAHVFQLLHEVAEDHDRVIFVTNSEPARRPADRGESLTPDALSFLTRMGVIHIAATTLFTLWKLSLQEPERARDQVRRLPEQTGGTFELPSTVLV